MATTDAVGDIVRVTIAVIQPDSQVQECNLNYLCSASGGADTRTVLGTTVRGLFTTNFRSVLSTASSYYGYKVNQINRKPSPAPVVATTTTAGTDDQPPLPTQVRPLLSFQTAFSGRKYRGRIFLFSPATDQVSAEGNPLAGLITAMGALGTALIPAVVSGGTTWQLCIAHRPKAPLTTWSSDAVTDYVVPGKWATQRKSGNYGRENPNPW